VPGPPGESAIPFALKAAPAEILDRPPAAAVLSARRLARRPSTSRALAALASRCDGRTRPPWTSSLRRARGRLCGGGAAPATHGRAARPDSARDLLPLGERQVPARAVVRDQWGRQLDVRPVPAACPCGANLVIGIAPAPALASAVQPLCSTLSSRSATRCRLRVDLMAIATRHGATFPVLGQGRGGEGGEAGLDTPAITAGLTSLGDLAVGHAELDTLRA
jgi:hypothetical protein